MAKRPPLTKEYLATLHVPLIDVSSKEELNEVLVSALASAGTIMYAKGMDTEDAKKMLDTIANMNKWFAGQYHRLCEEGKIPPEDQYKRG